MSTKTMQPRIDFIQIKQLQNESRHARMGPYESHAESRSIDSRPTPAPLPMKGSFQNLHMAHCNPLDLRLDLEAPQQHPTPLNSPDLEVTHSGLTSSFLDDDDESDESDGSCEINGNNKRVSGTKKLALEPLKTQDNLTQTLTQKISTFPLRPHSPKIQKFNNVPKHRSSKNLKSLLKVQEGQLNYVVYSSKDNLSDATIFGTQINILQTVAYHSQQRQEQKKQARQQQQHLQEKGSNENAQESVNPAIPLPQTEYETVSIRVNKSIKEEYKKRKRLEDRGGYYASVNNEQVSVDDDMLENQDNGEQQLAQEQDEYALIKAFKLACGKSNDSTASQNQHNNNDHRVVGPSSPHSNDDKKSQKKKKHRHLVWDLSHG